VSTEQAEVRVVLCHLVVWDLGGPVSMLLVIVYDAKWCVAGYLVNTLAGTEPDEIGRGH
jgi:hypothetical protein